VQLSWNGRRLEEAWLCQDYNIKNYSVVECSLVPEDRLYDESDGDTSPKQIQRRKGGGKADAGNSSISVSESVSPSENTAKYGSDLRDQPAPSKAGPISFKRQRSVPKVSAIMMSCCQKGSLQAWSNL
jgi:hypothetical protein